MLVTDRVTALSRGLCTLTPKTLDCSIVPTCAAWGSAKYCCQAWTVETVYEDLRSSRAHQQRLHGDTASCHYDNPRCRQWRQKLSNWRLIVFIETVNRSPMNKIKEVFLWSSKSFTLPQPANHFFIKLNLLRVINTEISHACCSLCWKTYNTALNCRYCPLIVKLLPILLSQMTCRMLLGCSRCTLNFVCFTYLCFATTSTAENSTIQGRLKPSHKRLLRVNVSSHRHMT